MNFISGLKPTFTKEQINRLSNVFDNAGQVFLGVAVLSPIVSNLTVIDKIQPMVILLGLISAVFCWLVSINFAKKGI